MQPGCPLGNNHVFGTGFNGLERPSPLAVVGGDRIHSVRHGDRMDQVPTKGQGRRNAPIQPSVVNRRVRSDHRGRDPVAVGPVVSSGVSVPGWWMIADDLRGGQKCLRLAREQRVPVLAAIPATAGLPSTVMARRKQCAPRARGRPRASRRSPPQDRP